MGFRAPNRWRSGLVLRLNQVPGSRRWRSGLVLRLNQVPGSHRWRYGLVLRLNQVPGSHRWRYGLVLRLNQRARFGSERSPYFSSSCINSLRLAVIRWKISRHFAAISCLHRSADDRIEDAVLQFRIEYS